MSTQVAPEKPDIGQLLSDGWQSDSEGVGRHFCRNYKTGQRTALCETPMAAFRAAAAIQKGERAAATPENPAPGGGPQPVEAQGLGADPQNGRNNIPENIPAASPESARPREVFYMVTEMLSGRFMVDLCFSADEREHDPDDKSALVALAEGGGRRVVSRHGLDTPAEELFASIGDDSRLVPPHDYQKEELNDWCEVCFEDRGSVLHPISDEHLVAVLSLADVEVSEEVVRGWTPKQRGEAVEWAGAVHLKASDNDDVEVPTRPEFLPASAVASFSPSDEVEKGATGDIGLDPTPYVPDEHAGAGADPFATTLLDLDLIRTDGGTQMRVGALDERIVAEYTDAWYEMSCRANGLSEMPPVIVFFDGSDHWLADGFYRRASYLRFLEAHPLTAAPRALLASVRRGTRRDAVLYAVSANARHGLRRTDADKRRAVETLLRDEVWSKWSNREIARQCGVSKGFVGDVREELTGARAPEEVTARRGGSEYTVSTANLAGPKSAPAEATPSGASQTSASEQAAPPPSDIDEAEGAEPHPADASAGAPDSSFTVTDRRIRHEDAPAAHVAARPDRVAELKKRLKGRALIISHTLMPGDLGVQVTVNVAGAPPDEAVISALFTPEKVRWLGEVEYEVACQRLDAEKRKPKAAKKSAVKKAAVKSSKKGAPKSRSTSPLDPANFKKGDTVLVLRHGKRTTGTVVGKSAKDARKLRVKVAGATYEYFPSQFLPQKPTGSSKKPAGRK
jgi:hypothetical protein